MRPSCRRSRSGTPVCCTPRPTECTCEPPPPATMRTQSAVSVKSNGSNINIQATASGVEGTEKCPTWLAPHAAIQRECRRKYYAHAAHDGAIRSAIQIIARLPAKRWRHGSRERAALGPTTTAGRAGCVHAPGAVAVDRASLRVARYARLHVPSTPTARRCANSPPSSPTQAKSGHSKQRQTRSDVQPSGHRTMRETRER